MINFWVTLKRVSEDLQDHANMDTKKQKTKWHAGYTVNMTYLLLELTQLSRQVGHQPHGRFQLLLQVPDFILLSLCITAHQGHGTHPWEPVQVVLLVAGQAHQLWTSSVQ